MKKLALTLASVLISSGALAAEHYKLRMQQVYELNAMINTIDAGYTDVDKDGKQLHALYHFDDKGVTLWKIALATDHLNAVVRMAQGAIRSLSAAAQEDSAKADIEIARASCPAEGDKEHAPSVACAEARLAKLQTANKDAAALEAITDREVEVDLEPISKDDMKLDVNTKIPPGMLAPLMLFEPAKKP